jgi:hypothetical protein
MKQGIIFTKDKTEIDVFFLKEQVPPELGWQLGHQIGDGSAENPILVDEETGKALAGDLGDCCDETSSTMSLLDMPPLYEGPVGHVGKTGWKGYDSAYDAILDTIKRFEDTQLNISSETAQEVLAMSIEVKLKHFYDEK